jgi:hypothetical protein
MPVPTSRRRPWSGRDARAPIDAFVSAAALDLRLSRTSTVVILLLPAAVVAAAVLSAGLGTGVYKALVREDGPVENLQFVLFAGASFGALVLARLHHREGRRGIAAVFVLAAIGLFGIAGEEISWGQRIFGWGTPEALAEINRQGETTLHNVETIEELVRWSVFGVAVAATVAALLYDRGPRHARHPVVRALVPSRVFVPAFVLIAGWRMYRETVVPPASLRFAISEFTEIVELVMASTVAIFLALQLRDLRAAQRPDAAPDVADHTAHDRGAGTRSPVGPGPRVEERSERTEPVP